ncbi:peptide-methionine (S)-S-oxide reductase [Aquimarina sp. MMG016]|uniref:peptide-methionine (S)-S-oxide reductase n=1 Tax=Aquimarina sp. MMG016 TaxID=2822690 RepID=UPI001B3A555A|nr:peptide-methionine (S)-S-oxide reductase [Aquimarina sp. MMG016]MBQ4820505.1 peptide-methionine (S)-S-oxide reductase [Aquimarina sp. MMG016]
MSDIKKIGLGGGCHWCTEAVFQSLKGIANVEQGHISSDESMHFSEAVIVSYDPKIIPLKHLIEIHLHTHKSTVNHSFRNKYRSAIYYFEEISKNQALSFIEELQREFDDSIITKVLPFQEFQPSREELLNYYQKNPEKPFCKKYIHPKLELLKSKYSKMMKYNSN